MGNFIERALLLLISASLIVSIFAVSGGTISEIKDTNTGLGTTLIVLDDHDPIQIDNDADLISQAASESWAGNGTLGDPYIISGYDINATGHGIGVYIGNTTAHLIVRGCQVHDADTPERVGTLPIWNWGIVLNNVTSAVIENNICARSTVGICLCESELDVVRGNAVTDEMMGVEVFKSDKNLIESNELSDVNYGVVISYSKNNTISGNTVHDSTACVLVEFSSHNVMTENTLYECLMGIDLQNSADTNEVSDNTIHDCEIYGIEIFGSEKNNITGNVCIRCDQGISLDSLCQLNIVANNHVRDSIYGVYAKNNDNNYIRGNVLENNDHGIYMGAGADDTKISSNVIRNNYNGIYLKDADDLEISKNTISFNGDGIYAEDGSDHCWINNNVFQDNYCGIYLWNSSNSNISNNTLVDNTFGMDLDDARSSSIYSNLVRGSASYGLHMNDGSSGNAIVENAFVDNNGAGEVYDQDHVQARSTNGTNDWNDAEGGNYWSDWLTPDADHNGIVDLEYAIGGGVNADELPITTSYLYTAPLIGDITGMLTDEHDLALSGVTISLSTGASTVTDTNGHFSFVNVTAGTYVVTFAKMNCSVVQKSVTVTDQATANMGTVMVSEVLADGGTLNDDGAFIAYVALVIVTLVAVAAIIIMYFRMKK